MIRNSRFRFYPLTSTKTDWYGLKHEQSPPNNKWHVIPLYYIPLFDKNLKHVLLSWQFKIQHL